ncbi:uncharacterized protein WM294_010786 [Sarcoramphus papa]
MKFGSKRAHCGFPPSGLRLLLLSDTAVPEPGKFWAAHGTSSAFTGGSLPALPACSLQSSRFQAKKCKMHPSKAITQLVTPLAYSFPGNKVIAAGIGSTPSLSRRRPRHFVCIPAATLGPLSPLEIYLDANRRASCHHRCPSPAVWINKNLFWIKVPLRPLCVRLPIHCTLISFSELEGGIKSLDGVRVGERFVYTARLVLTPPGAASLPQRRQKDGTCTSGWVLPNVFQAELEMGSRWEELKLAQGIFDSG